MLLALGVLAAGALVATAGSSARAQRAAVASVRVPAVAHRRLDLAEAMLQLRGLRSVEKGGGFFGIVVKHNWVVCIQTPAAGRLVPRGTRVTLFATRPGQC